MTLDSYVRRQSVALLRLAYLLTGDHHRANDLVQTTLTKVLPRGRTQSRTETRTPMSAPSWSTPPSVGGDV